MSLDTRLTLTSLLFSAIMKCTRPPGPRDCHSCHSPNSPKLRRYSILRRWGLPGTRLARAQCGTIRLKLLKIGVQIRVSVQAVRLSFDEGFPEAGLFGQVLARLQSLPLRC